MSRLASVFGLLVLPLCLAPGVWAQDDAAPRPAPRGLQFLEPPPQTAPPADAQAQPGQTAGPLTPRGGPSESDPGYEALVAGREAREQGDLQRAASLFQEALIQSGPGTAVYRAAREELDFRLPLARVEDLIADQAWQEVDEALSRLLGQHGSDPAKSLYLLRLISQLQEQVPGDVTGRQRGPEDRFQVVESIELELEGFLEEKGRYPRGYEELNTLLPPDQDPLTEYDIVEYVASGRAYGLTLRSKDDPGNVIKLQKTGLLE